MFPLGSVLVPGAPLPLHVFEPRYRALVRDCLAGEPEFGVVLIERGSEVGGGDDRFGVGTLARIVEVAEFPDGRYALTTVGTRRFTVHRWLPEEPYPAAEIEILDEPVPGALARGRAAEVEQLLRRVLALASRLGVAVAPSDVRIGDDPASASYRAVALAPFGPLDRQRLLELPGADERLDALASMLAEELDLLEGDDGG
jgi:Lon protease-like protein